MCSDHICFSSTALPSLHISPSQLSWNFPPPWPLQFIHLLFPAYSKDSQEGSAHIVQESKDYWITADFTFKRFPSLCQRFVPLRCSITCKSLYLAQLRGLKDILKANCCKEFLCTAAHLCPLKETPLFSGAVPAAGELDPEQGMSSRGNRKDNNPVTIFFSWISYWLCLGNKINNPCTERTHLSRGHREPLEDDAWCPWETELSQHFPWLFLPLPPLGQSVSQS